MVATLAAYWFVGRATEQSFDRFLQDDAYALATKVQWRGTVASFAGDEATAESVVFDSLARARYLVQSGSGRTLVGNARLQLPASMEPLASGVPVFFDVQHPAGALRAVALSVGRSPDKEPVRILVAESKTARQQAYIEIARAIFVPAALVGFVILPLIYLGIRRGLAPTEAISPIVAQRGIHDLSPLPLNNVPDELRGLVRHTNALLLRLDAAVAEQRRFLSDAAHQLQTPVAGIRLLVGDLRRFCRSRPVRIR